MPADGAVHRVEALGGEALYEAVSPITTDCFDYCLAHASPEVALRLPSDIPATITGAITNIMKYARIELGSVEYLLDAEGQPRFIDLNPVSSLRPEAAHLLGRDPIDCIAEYLWERLGP